MVQRKKIRAGSKPFTYGSSGKTYCIGRRKIGTVRKTKRWLKRPGRLRRITKKSKIQNSSLIRKGYYKDPNGRYRSKKTRKLVLKRTAVKSNRKK